MTSPPSPGRATGSEIRRARREANLSQTDLGSRSGYSASAISRIESGHRKLDVVTLHRLARALDQPVARFGLADDRPSRGQVARSDEARIRLLSYGDGANEMQRLQHRLPGMVETAHMTTLRGLAAVRESIQIALDGDPEQDELAYIVRTAADHYAAIYSKIPPGLLYEEVLATRSVVLGSQTESGEPRAACGWLTALLGNLSFHLSDPAAARLHLTTAAGLGRRFDDADLRAWANGALAMVARSEHDDSAALSFGRRAVEAAPPGLRRAQMLMWAYLPSIAARGEASEVDTTIAEADRELDASPTTELSGRFGFDLAERNLHVAEALLLLGRHRHAARIAESSVAATTENTPGWAAASLLLAQAEAANAPADAAARALDVLTRIPPDRLRATARDRLTHLTSQLSMQQARSSQLSEHVNSLPPLVDAFGWPTTHGAQ